MAALALSILAVGPAPSAGADGTGTRDADSDETPAPEAILQPNADGSYTVGANVQYGGQDVPTRSSGQNVVCKFYDLGPDIDPAGYGGLDRLRAHQEESTELIDGMYYDAICTVDGEGVVPYAFLYTEGQPTVSPEFLAHQAFDTMTVAYPTPSTSPSIEHDHLVGLATWLWIDPGGFEPVTATASIPGLSVTATAAPTKVVWDMGDDTEPIVCDDAGTAYDTNGRPEDQSTDCSHVYQWHGNYTATATTTWDISWSATNGDGGTFASIDRTTSFDLHVVERQAVVTG